MKHINKIIIYSIALLAFPFISFATINGGWNASSKAASYISPISMDGSTIPFIKVPYIVATSSLNSPFSGTISIGTANADGVPLDIIGGGDAVHIEDLSNDDYGILHAQGGEFHFALGTRDGSAACPNGAAPVLGIFVCNGIYLNVNGENEYFVNGAGDYADHTFYINNVAKLRVTNTGKTQVGSDIGLFVEPPQQFNVVSGNSYFANRIGIASTSPSRALSVNGSSDLGTNALAGYFTATTSIASQFPYASSTMTSAATGSTTNEIVSSLGSSAGTFVAADKTGKLIATSSAVFVPYIGATTDVDLGSHVLTVSGINLNGDIVSPLSLTTIGGQDEFITYGPDGVTINDNIGAGITLASSGGDTNVLGVLAATGDISTAGCYTIGHSCGPAGSVLTATALATSIWQPVATALAATSTASYRNKTASIPSVNKYTPTASSTYQISVDASVNAISAGTLTITCTYTNTHGTATTATFFPMGLTTAGLSSTGSPSLSPLIITPMSNTAITVVATFAGVSINYDIDASINPVGTGTN